MSWKPADVVERSALSLSGVALLASAGLAGRMAVAHMQSSGVLCGVGAVDHCAWCAATVGLAMAGVSALLLALPPRLRWRKAGGRAARG